jgi:hypothetical protein
MEEKKLQVKEIDVPIDITKSEYKKLKENLKLFNSNVAEGSKLNFDEFVSLVFETKRLEERLDSKYNYLKILKAEVKQLEEELDEKYAIGLTGCEEVNREVKELRKQIIIDSSDYINGSY